jgi:vanillate O-demethylase monooxygenase subunit
MASLPGAVIDNVSALWRRSWHAVATSAEVTAQPSGIDLLGRRWSLARVGADVVAVTGRRRAEPVEPWGVAERYGLVWLAPEEPLCDLPDFGEWDDPRFTTATSTLVRTPAGAAQLVDNFLDAAHFPFVHASTFGVEESSEVSDRGVVRDGWQVETTFDTWYRNVDDPLVATGEHRDVQPQVLLKRAGVSLSVFLRLQFPVTGATIAILFACTPETAEVTRVYKLLARDDLGGDEGRLEAFVADEDTILAEDLAILERYRHRYVPLDRRAEIHTRADRLSLAWRSLLAECATPAPARTGGRDAGDA